MVVVHVGVVSVVVGVVIVVVVVVLACNRGSGNGTCRAGGNKD